MKRFGKISNKSRAKANLPYKELLFVLIGSIGGSVFTQVFYTDNKIVDSDYALHKDINSQQFPLVNRLVNFYWNYDLQQPDIITRPNTLQHSDILYRTIPRFIKDSTERKFFMSDLEYFNENRQLIDATILVNLRPVQHFLKFYSIPPVHQDSILKSAWYNQDVQKQWHELVMNLNESAYHFMHMGR